MSENPTFVANSDSPEWHAARYSGIGSSEAAAACGLSKWQQTRSLYHLKRAEIFPEMPTDSMQFAKVLESAVAIEWARRNNREIANYPVGMHRSANFQFMLATPDVELVKLSEPEGVEIKCMGWRMAKNLGEEKTDEIPVEYLVQSQQQIAVMGWARVFVVVMIDVHTVKEYVVNRDENLIVEMQKSESEMWERIENGDPPAVDFEHRDRKKLIKNIGRHIEFGKTAQLSPELVSDYRKARELRSESKRLKDEADKLIDRVRFEIGLAEFGAGPGLKLRRKHIVTNRKASTSEQWRLDEDRS